MSNRLVFALSIVAFLSAATGAMVPSAVAADHPDPCFGGLVVGSNSGGKVTGSDCSDVIVAGEETTTVDGGAGDDVIIGSPNTVLIEGGDGSDYIIGNSFAAILIGGYGDDILDAGIPVKPDKMSEGAEKQIESTALALPEFEAIEFRETVFKELQILSDSPATDRDIDRNLRQSAIASDPVVQSVIGTPEAGEKVDDQTRLDAEGLARQVSAFARTSEQQAQGVRGGDDSGESAIAVASRDWGKDPIWGEVNHNDILIGGRGSDEIHGRSGDDLLYGGIEDDELLGEGDDDYMLGGFGSDRINGGVGDDIAQGDATGDKMTDGGGDAHDVLSFASGGTDGFSTVSMSAYPNFPAGGSPERGVYVNLTTGVANNGSVVGGGGGTDPPTGTSAGTTFSDFEGVIGTPFADYIVGSSDPNFLEGGGGSDVIVGGGSAGDTLVGDAGGDNLTGAAGSSLDGGPGEDYCGGTAAPSNCEPKASNWVGVRDTSKISVGMTTQAWGSIYTKSQIYMAGSTANWVTRNGEDAVTVTQFDDGSGPPSFKFSTSYSTIKGQFSLLPEDETPGCSYTATEVICSPATTAVTLVLAGFGSNDSLSTSSVSEVTDPVILGGQGSDTLTGGNYTNDFMHDGADNDTLIGKAGDDGFVNTFGLDTIAGDEGNDLVESNSVCEGDVLNGGGNFDSSSWVQYQTAYPAGATNGVFASILSNKVAKNIGDAASCSGEGAMNSIYLFEDLEGSRNDDYFIGDSSANQLIGRATGDTMYSKEGNDRILANSDDEDYSDCGAGTDDIVVRDYSANSWDVVTGCETVNYADPIFADS